MIKKIPCGGFSYDDTEIAFEDGVIHPIGGGGGGMLIGHIHYNEDDDTYSCDKTFAELSAAVPNVMLKAEDGESNSVFSLFSYGSSYVAFQYISTSGLNEGMNYIEYHSITIAPDDSVQYDFYERFFE